MDAVEPILQPFGEILRRHQGRVRAYLRRFVMEADLADDLAQETFLAAYRSLPHRNPAAPVDLWLLSIARHRALKHLRDEARRRDREARPLKAALSAWAADQMQSETPDWEDHERQVSALKQCLAGLPRHSAGLLSDYYYQHLTSSEIARKWGKKESAVRMTLLRLREALKQCVELRKMSAEPGV